jgi:hypothetical protein
LKAKNDARAKLTAEELKVLEEAEAKEAKDKADILKREENAKILT